MNSSLVKPLTYFEWGLELNLETPKDVEDWAIDRVGAIDSPDPDLCDLATAASLSVHELLATIRPLIGIPQRKDVLPILFSRVRRHLLVGRLSVTRAAEQMNAAVQQVDALDDGDYMQAFLLSQEYESVTNGVPGDLEEIERQLGDYLDDFEIFEETLRDAL